MNITPKAEPVMYSNIVAAIMSFLTMLVAFGWNVNDEQLAAVQNFLQNSLPVLIPLYFLIAGWIGRQNVVAVKKLEYNGVDVQRLYDL